jgi:ribosomal protein RSM22 (predicted rRNA methylase)
MNETLQNFVLRELCPDGVWQLSDVVKSLLIYKISRLPKGEVSEDETRCPQSLKGMRAFLSKFFARHYFQTQNSLFDYMTSQDFFDVFRHGHLRILDVGSGPAAASLAITNVLVCVLEHLKGVGEWPKDKMVKVEYVLNDTSGICLGTGHSMLSDYFRIIGRNNTEIIHSRTTRLQKAFPDNMNQLRWIAHNLGPYDIVTFCYVVSPLNEDKGFDGLVNGLLEIERLCNMYGRILILQDRFQVALVRQMSRAIGVSSRKEESTQAIYPNKNTNETYTYTYYSCLYAPGREMTIRQSHVA